MDPIATPYSCSICNKAFAILKSLGSHVEIYHAQKNNHQNRIAQKQADPNIQKTTESLGNSHIKSNCEDMDIQSDNDNFIENLPDPKNDPDLLIFGEIKEETNQQIEESNIQLGSVDYIENHEVKIHPDDLLIFGEAKEEEKINQQTYTFSAL